MCCFKLTKNNSNRKKTKKVSDTIEQLLWAILYAHGIFFCVKIKGRRWIVCFLE